MKIYTAYLAHESNSFSPIPTSLDNFRESGLYLPSSGEGSEILDEDFTDDLAFIDIAKSRGHEVVVGPVGAAGPSAPINRADYEKLRDELIDQLRQALPVDAVCLFLHGAQLAQGYDDVSGDILERVRDCVGPEIPIGLELDLHCNISPKMLETATAILPCKEYPHIDFAVEGERMVRIIEQAATGRCRPVMAFAPVPILGYFHTTRQPLEELVDRCRQLEKRDGILSVGLAHGFGLADAPYTGAGALVITDDDDDLANETAHGLAADFFAMREDIKAPLLALDEALDQALASGDGPAILADTTDNAGGGAAGDSTFVLRALLERGVRDVALGLIYDPEAVTLASMAGEGARIPIRIGGKVGPLSGDPVDLDATVKTVRGDGTQILFNSRIPLGPAVTLEAEGIEIVVNALRQQLTHPDGFTTMGIDLADKRMIVVKSAQHFYSAFAPMASKVVYAAPPGSVTNDFGSLPYKSLTRPMWPIDAPPFEKHGKLWS